MPASSRKGKARKRGLVLSDNGRQERVVVKERLSNMELPGPEWERQNEKALRERDKSHFYSSLALWPWAGT